MPQKPPEMVWLRYVGSPGWEVQTFGRDQRPLAVLGWGECALVPREDVEFLLTSEIWVAVPRRCQAKAAFTKKRCVQRAMEGEDFCLLHSRERRR